MKRIYNKKEEGIASTVGTIFALMIFTALLGMFMTQVVPVTMKQNEAEHDIQVLSQFAQMRSMIDILSLTRNTNYTAYVPIKLGADGIPFFASPTYGQLSLYPSQINPNYQMDLQFLDKFGNNIYRNASGSIQFIAPNKYYVPEIFEYANGGIMRYNFQTKNSVFPVTPSIRFENVALGYALNFTGTDTATVITETSSLSITGPITIESWIYLRSLNDQTFLVNPGQYKLELSGGTITFTDDNGDGVSTYALSTSNLNKWLFVAAVFDGKKGDTLSSSNIQIYINGNPAVSVWPTSEVWSPAASPTGNLQLGTMDGMLDEVRVLYQALDQNEVESDYLAGHHFPTRYATAAWYHLDEGTGTLANDSSGNNNTLTLTSSNMWVALTGVNVYATLQNLFGNPGSITGTETRSIGISLEGISTETYSIGGTLNITFKDYYAYTQSFALNFTGYWLNYTVSMLNSAGLKLGTDYTITGDVIHIAYVNQATVNMVYLGISIER
ncbi:MAG: LamG domain-containing protein [Euryarchaeota archaeon]|nr:LamG domain-containing protein [Euryarchaeota archaeon]